MQGLKPLSLKSGLSLKSHTDLSGYRSKVVCKCGYFCRTQTRAAKSIDFFKSRVSLKVTSDRWVSKIAHFCNQVFQECGVEKSQNRDFLHFLHFTTGRATPCAFRGKHRTSLLLLASVRTTQRQKVTKITKLALCARARARRLLYY